MLRTQHHVEVEVIERRRRRQIRLGRTRIFRRSRSDGNDPKPTLDEMIEAAAKLPPGPDAWEPIFEACPEVTPEELIEKFRQSAERAQREADQLRAYARQRGIR